MTLPIVDRHAHVLDGKSGNRALGEHLTHAFLDCRYVLARNGSAYHIVHELEPGAALERFDAQEHFAELARTARLFLVAAVPLGRTHDGLAVWNARRMRLHAHAVVLGHALEHH